MKYETKHTTAYLPTYFATKDDKFLKDLPMTCTNVASAAEYFVKLVDQYPNNLIKIFERYKVLNSNGDIVTKVYNVTDHCIDIIWNHYASQNV